MSALDIFVVVLLGGGAMIGFVRGLVHEVLSLLAWVVGIVALRLFHSPVSEALTGAVGTPTAGAVLAFVLLFLPSFLFMKLLARSIGKKSRSSMLGPFDRVLGAGFGMLKGLLAVTLFFLMANLATDLIYGPDEQRPDWMRNSRTYPLLNASGRAVVDWVETRRKGSATSIEDKPGVIRLHDTMTREKRPFVPINPQRITMYVCGPTVYGRAHIGNARPAVVFDTLARLIRHEFGEKSLVYARNVTDVDDKIIAAAEKEGVDPSVITERYERHYLEDMGALGVIPPDIAPHATQEIPAMIAMIERLVETGHAYEADGPRPLQRAVASRTMARSAAATARPCSPGPGSRSRPTSAIPRTSCCGSRATKAWSAGIRPGAGDARAGMSNARR